MLLRENPHPVPARTLRPSSANTAREEEQHQAWELLAQEALDEDAYLKELAGVEDLATATSLQVVVNTTTSTVSHLGSKLPSLYELSLNNSMLECLRDLGTGFTQLRVLWVSRCGLTSLDGASGFPALRELYAAFNDVADLQALDACAELEVLDLEGNCVADADMIPTLAPLTNLLALTLSGNPICLHPGYRHRVCTSLPSLCTLDEVEVGAVDRGPHAADTLLGQHGGGGDGGEDVGAGSSGEVLTGGQANGGSGGSREGTQLQQQAAGVCPAQQQPAAHRAAAGAVGGIAGRATDSGGVPAAQASAGGSELDMVQEGIKRARVGMDSHEFREMEMAVLLEEEGGDEEAGPGLRAASACSSTTGAPPGSSASSDTLAQPGIPSTPPRLQHRPSSASPLMPFSTGSWIRTLRASQAGSSSTSESILQGASCDGTTAQPPQIQQSPQAGIGATASRPSSARHTFTSGPGKMRSLSAASARPFSARIGTAGAAATGPGGGEMGRWMATGASAPPTADGGLYWRKHRLQAAHVTSGGILDGRSQAWAAALKPAEHDDDDASDGTAAASALTLGGSAIGGSLARDLRRRRKAAAGNRMGRHGGGGLYNSIAVVGQQGGGTAEGAVYDAEALLQELRKWKVETADRALLPEEGPAEGAWGDAETSEVPLLVQRQVCVHSSHRQDGVRAGRADILDLQGAGGGGEGQQLVPGIDGTGLQGEGEECVPGGGGAGAASRHWVQQLHRSSSSHHCRQEVAGPHGAPAMHRATSSVHGGSRPQSGSSRQPRMVLVKVIRDVGSMQQHPHHHHHHQHRYRSEVRDGQQQACAAQGMHPHLEHTSMPSSSCGSRSSRAIPSDQGHLYAGTSSQGAEIDITSANPRPLRRDSP